jgi:prepilin-type N-terminal cleavage/methylation domain-containing protein
MRCERGAWSAERGARLAAVGSFYAPSATRHDDRPAGAAFTLIEILVVVALVAILSALLVPSMQGLFGVVGRRAGANTLALGIEQARLEAIKHGTASFVGFINANNEAAFSSFIIYRALRFDEAATNTNLVTAVSRWIRLPRGVFMEPKDLAGVVSLTQSISAGILPRFAGTSISSVRSIKFDRFGKLATTDTNPPTLRVGEGLLKGTELTFIPNEGNYYELSIQPLTGQVAMRDGALDSP